MNYSIVQQSNPENIKTACLIVTVFAQQKLEAAGKHVNQASQEELGKLLKLSQFDGEIGKTATFYKLPGITAERVLVVGCGQPSKLDAGSLQRIHNAVATQLLELQIEDAAMLLEDIVVPERDMAWHIRQCIVNIDAARYRFDDFKAQEKPKKKLRLRKLALITQTREKLAAKQTAAKQAHAISLGVAKARDLGNLPGNVCTPSYLAKQAKSLQKDYPKLDVQILSESDMKKLGMGAFLSVSKGSTEPGKMIVMEFMNGKKDKPPVVLVGKGITFDTGGISIKQAPKMDEMKYDMCGAATVLGVINACAEMDLAVNLVGVVAAAENMPSGGASKPGDIVTSLSGQTIEILNTDAEGRLVLCDALSYVERYQPSAVIDIATLTGACIVALGRVPSGLFSNHQALAEALLEAGQLSHDRVWQMPVWDDYQELLKSNFADVANIGGPDGGSITAACFLSRFTKAYHWAHLDVAGTAWLTGPQKGATGRPVPLLMQYLMDRHAS